MRQPNIVIYADRPTFAPPRSHFNSRTVTTAPQQKVKTAMRKAILVRLTATVATVGILSGCAAPTPESCSLYPNQTAGGALIGAGVGTAIGAIASRGSAGGMLAGAGIGMLVGAAIGQKQDQACYQLAMRTAFEQAEADRRAYEYQLQQMQASRQAQQSRPVAQFRSVAWRSKDTGNGGTITPTNNFTDQATGRNCWMFEDRPVAADGTSGPSVTKRACMGADGNVVPGN